MKIFMYCFFVSVLSLSIKAQEVTKVLFIGSTITTSGGMPETFEDIANALGNSTEISKYCPLGTGIINHITDSNVYANFKEGDWDYVILQPATGEAPGYGFVISETINQVKMLRDSIIHYNPCATVVMYENPYAVWGSSASELLTYTTAMDLILENTVAMADSAQGFMAPIGEAYKTSWISNPSYMLWDTPGNINSNESGAYLGACVLYASIFQQPSLGCTVINSLPMPMVTYFQNMADSIVLNYLSNWRINTYNQFTGFEFSMIANEIYFNNLSVNTDSVFWDFGNGQFSTDFNPVIAYSTEGVYPVELTTYKNGCIETRIKEIGVSFIDLEEFNQGNQFTVFPNPTKDHLTIECITQSLNVFSRIYNLSGQIVLKSKGSSLDVSHLPDGLYYIEIIDDTKQVVNRLKWVKN